MSYIENTYLLSKDDLKRYKGGVNDLLNHSNELDDLAAKLVPSVLQSACDAYIPQETKKTRFVDMMNGLAALFRVMHIAEMKADISTSNEPWPVFIVKDHYDCEVASGFYFFVGYYAAIYERLAALCEEPHNLKENQH